MKIVFCAACLRKAQDLQHSVYSMHIAFIPSKIKQKLFKLGHDKSGTGYSPKTYSMEYPTLQQQNIQFLYVHGIRIKYTLKDFVYICT